MKLSRKFSLIRREQQSGKGVGGGPGLLLTLLDLSILESCDFLPGFSLEIRVPQGLRLEEKGSGCGNTGTGEAFLAADMASLLWKGRAAVLSWPTIIFLELGRRYQ